MSRVAMCDVGSRKKQQRTNQKKKGADPPTLLICFSHLPSPLISSPPFNSHHLRLRLSDSPPFLVPPRHEPPPEATYDDVDALKAACKQHVAAHLYSVTTK